MTWPAVSMMPNGTVLVAGAVLTAAAVAIATATAVGTHTSPPAPVVRDSDFTYIRSMVAYTVDSISDGHETSYLEKLHKRQIWLPG